MEIGNSKIIRKRKKLKKEKQQRRGFIKLLSKLPRDIQKKIYIICFRNFWREYVPLTAKIPSWYYRKIEIEREMFESRNNNIHFLHLSFNCIPEQKSYILGCQCEFCKGVLHMYKYRLAGVQFFNHTYFKSRMPHSSFEFNDYYVMKHGVLYKNYDALFNTVYEDPDTYAIRNNYPKLFFT